MTSDDTRWGPSSDEMLRAYAQPQEPSAPEPQVPPAAGTEEGVAVRRPRAPISFDPGEPYPPEVGGWEQSGWEPAVAPPVPAPQRGPQQVKAPGVPILKGLVGRGIWLLIAAAAWWGVTMFGSGTHIDTLTVGDCFQEPGNVAEVVNVDTVDCAEAHDYEVYGAFEHPAPDGAEFPGDFALLEWSDELCFDAFQPYVGTRYEQSMYYFDIAIPTEEAWDQGDRGALCVLYESLDGYTVDPIAGSARNSRK